METCKSGKLKLVRKDPIARAKSLTHGVLAPVASDSDLLPRVGSSCSSAADSSNPPSPPTPNPRPRSIVKAKSVDCSTAPLKLAATPKEHLDEGSPPGMENKMERTVNKNVDARDPEERKTNEGMRTRNVTPLGSGIRRGAGIALGVILFLGCVMVVMYLLTTLKVVQDVAGDTGILEQMVVMTKGSNRIFTLMSLHLIRRLTENNGENKERVVQQGILPVLVSIINSKDALDGDQILASSTIATLAKSSTQSRDAILANGAIPALVDAGKRAENPKVKAELVNALAIVLASRDDVFRNSVMAAQGADLFVEMLDSGMNPSHSASAAWALANLAHTNAAAQDVIGKAGGVEPLVRLLWSGSEQLESQTALLAVGNLVAHNSLNQDAVRDAGGVEAIVKLLEASVDAFSTQTAPSHLEVQFVQEILEAYKTNHIVHRAIREIGGVQMFIQLALPENFEALQHSYPFQNALVLVSGGSSGDALNGLSDTLNGWTENNIELGEDEGRLAGDVGENSNNEARCLQRVQGVLSEEIGVVGNRVLAERASWAVRNLAANNLANKDAVRKVGGVELLVRILGSTSSSPAALKSAAYTLAALAAQNTENQIVIRKAHGVETLIRLVGTHPDKDVIQAAARLLRILASGKDSKLDGRIETMGKWLAERIRFTTGLAVDPGKIWMMLACGGMFLLGVVVRTVIWKC